MRAKPEDKMMPAPANKAPEQSELAKAEREYAAAYQHWEDVQQAEARRKLARAPKGTAGVILNEGEPAYNRVMAALELAEAARRKRDALLRERDQVRRAGEDALESAARAERMSRWQMRGHEDA
jgi:hypothetical protein